jgi:hypothetical protein
MLQTSYTNALVEYSPLFEEKEKEIEEMSKKKFKFSAPEVVERGASTPDTFKFGQTPSDDNSSKISKQLFTETSFTFAPTNNSDNSFSFPNLEPSKVGGFKFGSEKEIETSPQKEDQKEVQSKPFYEMESNPFPFSGFSTEKPIENTFSFSSEKPITFSFGQKDDSEVFSDEEEENERILNAKTPAFSFSGEKVEFAFGKGEDDDKDDPVFSSEEEEGSPKKTDTSIFSENPFGSASPVKESNQRKKRRLEEEEDEDEEVGEIIVENDKVPMDFLAKIEAYNKSLESGQANIIKVDIEGSNEEFAFHKETENSEVDEENEPIEDHESGEEDQENKFDEESEEIKQVQTTSRKRRYEEEEEDEEEEVGEIIVENDNVPMDFLAKIEAYNKSLESGQTNIIKVDLEETESKLTTEDSSTLPDEPPKEEGPKIETTSKPFSLGFNFKDESNEINSTGFKFGSFSAEEPKDESSSKPFSLGFNFKDESNEIKSTGFQFGETPSFSFANVPETKSEKNETGNISTGFSFQNVPSFPFGTEIISKSTEDSKKEEKKNLFDFSQSKIEENVKPFDFSKPESQGNQTDIVFSFPESSSTGGFKIESTPITFSFGQKDDSEVFSDEEEENERILNAKTPAFSFSGEKVEFAFGKGEDDDEDDPVFSSEEEEEEDIPKKTDVSVFSGNVTQNEEEEENKTNSTSQQYEEEEDRAAFASSSEEGEGEGEGEEEEEEEISGGQEDEGGVIEISSSDNEKTDNESTQSGDEQEETQKEESMEGQSTFETQEYLSPILKQSTQESTPKNTQSTLNLEDFKSQEESQDFSVSESTLNFEDLKNQDSFSKNQEEEETQVARELWKFESGEEKKDDISDELKKEEEKEEEDKEDVKNEESASASENEFGKKRQGSTIIKSRKKRKK